MEVTINQKNYFIDTEHAQLQDALHAFGTIPMSGIAVALNAVVIPRAAWATTPIRPQDQILIIKAAQGG